MSSGDEEQSCGDVNFQVLTKAIEAAGETIMPFVDNITSTMSEACFAKLDEGDDILDSRALETLSELATGLRSVVQEDEFERTIMETAVDRILALLERVYFDDSGEEEEEEAKYHPLVAVILDFLCTYVTHCECAHAERAFAFIRRYCALLSKSTEDLSRAVDEWPNIFQVIQTASRQPSPFFSPTGGSPCSGAVAFASALLDDGGIYHARVAARVFLVMFNHCKDGWTPSLLEEVSLNPHLHEL